MMKNDNDNEDDNDIMKNEKVIMMIMKMIMDIHY